MQVRQSSRIAGVPGAADRLPGKDILPFNDIDTALGQVRIQGEAAIRMLYRDQVGTRTVTILAPVVSGHNGTVARGKDWRSDIHLEIVTMIPKSGMTVA